jgi:hypothetical protein
MTVYNRRNALVGFLTLKALERRRRRQRFGRSLKIALFVTLAVVSVGILAGVAAAFVKSKKAGVQHLEGYAAAEDAEDAEIASGAEAAEAAAAELDAAIAEPIPAT